MRRRENLTAAVITPPPAAGWAGSVLEHRQGEVMLVSPSYAQGIFAPSAPYPLLQVTKPLPLLSREAALELPHPAIRRNGP
jgi:hypothetical protein